MSKIVQRDQVTEDYYRVSIIDPDLSQESLFQNLTPDERRNMLPLSGFIQPEVGHLPEHRGFFCNIRGKLPES